MSLCAAEERPRQGPIFLAPKWLVDFMSAFAGSDADIFELVVAELCQVLPGSPVVPPPLDTPGYQFKKF
jgi:hypothetical protein